MKKPKELIYFECFNKKIKNPYIFICGGRSKGKSYALKHKEIFFEEVEHEN